MNIAIDVLAILGPDSKNRGIGNYATNQLKALFQLDKTNRYFLMNFYENTSLKDMLGYSDNVSEHYFYLGPDNFLSRDKNFRHVFGELIKKFVEENNIDIYYLTSPFDDHIHYEPEWFGKAKLFSTLYDIIPYIFKERYLADKAFLKKYLGWVELVKRSDKILAISQSTKDDFVQHFRVNPGKIDVIYAGVDECFRQVHLSDGELNDLKRRYGIEQSFIMCPAGDDERKNIAGMIEAFAKLPEHLLEKYQLVVVCKLSKASIERYTGLARKHHVGHKVVFTNYVPQDDLIKLYNAAHVVAFPSLYEGFGLPVVEAMACGTPVLTSSNSSLGEIAKHSALLVDPFKTEEIARGLIEILETSDRDALIRRGLERAHQFNWDLVAKKTLDAFSSVDNLEAAKLTVEKVKSSAKKRIAFFTPLPPLESGIADYSADILRKLSGDYDIDIFVDRHYTPAYELQGNMRIFVHDKFPRMKDQYDQYVFQMGNSEYHIYMIPYIRECAGQKGVLVLHDVNLHGMLHFMANRSGDWKLYRRFLCEDYDEKLVNGYIADLNAGRSGPKIFEMPCNGFVTKYVQKIIVHSDFAKKQLLQRDIGFNVSTIPLYVQIQDLRDRQFVRDKLNIAPGCIVLAAFGHIHPTKRIMPIVKAFHELSKTDDRLKLYLVGKPASFFEEELNQYIKQNHLSDKVVVTGFVDLETFEDYLDAADLCFNLRYPYNGESSASLMRALAKGKCVIVNDLGSFSEIPDDCCIKLPSPETLSAGKEAELIMNETRKLLEDHGKKMTIEKKAREYAQVQLNINRVGEMYQEALNEKRMKKQLISEDLLYGLMKHITINKAEMDIFNLAYTLSYLKQ